MKGLFKRDSYWGVFGIKTKSDFNSKINIESKFHSNVPKDIVSNFETAIYLLNFSYYHFKLLDEAVTKILVTLELAVKLKAKELLISLKNEPNKRGYRSDKRYQTLIKETITKNNQLYLKPDFERARSMRNNRIHIDRHFFMGVLGYPIKNIMCFMNLINQLFLDSCIIDDINKNQAKITLLVERLKNDLCVLEFNGTKILIDNIYKAQYFNDGNVKFLILFVNPVINEPIKYFSNKVLKEPLMVVLTEIVLTENTIEGVDFLGEKVKVYKSTKNENKVTYKKYQNELKNVPSRDLDIYEAILLKEYPWMMEKVIYDKCWVN